MQTLNTIAALQHLTTHWRREQLRIGLVATMGNLHAGHMALVKQGLQQCDRLVVSIFVNALQFNSANDLKSYPRTLAEDTALLAKHGAHVLFHPTEGEIYPSDTQQQTKVLVPHLSELHCGASRPGHFMGVATVVTKLLNIIKPDISFWGEKDFQQLLIIKQLITDLFIPVEVISVATVRDKDGLALSSRNHLLTSSHRQIAPVLYQQLQAIAAAIQQGHRNYTQLSALAQQQLQAAGFIPDYLSVCERTHLQLATTTDQQLVILAAARLGEVRLIDNLQLDI